LSPIGTVCPKPNFSHSINDFYIDNTWTKPNFSHSINDFHIDNTEEVKIL
jgi:hypothetical protein